MRRIPVFCLALILALVRLWGGEVEISLKSDKSLAIGLENGGIRLMTAVFRAKPSFGLHIAEASAPAGGVLDIGDYAPLGAARLVLSSAVSDAPGPPPSGPLAGKGSALSGIAFSKGPFQAFWSGPIFRPGVPKVLGALGRGGGVLWGFCISAFSEAEARKEGLSTNWRTRFPDSPLFSLLASCSESSGPLRLDLAVLVGWNAKLGLARSCAWSAVWEMDRLRVLAERRLAEEGPTPLAIDGGSQPSEVGILQVSSFSGKAEAKLNIRLERFPRPPSPAQSAKVKFLIRRKLILALGKLDLSLEGSSACRVSSDGAFAREDESRLALASGLFGLGIRVENLAFAGLEASMGSARLSTDLARTKCSIICALEAGGGKLRLKFSENHKLELSYVLSIPD